MAVAILKYNLSDPDDKMEFERAIKSLDMAMMLWELMINGKKNLERQLEADENTTEREFDLVDKVWQHIWSIAKEHDINIENLLR
tara:strand:- start:7496 stop:7750 length:255 start_codon:yes stop_codon:yes gene_type:complete